MKYVLRHVEYQNIVIGKDAVCIIPFYDSCSAFKFIIADEKFRECAVSINDIRTMCRRGSLKYCTDYNNLWSVGMYSQEQQMMLDGIKLIDITDNIKLDKTGNYAICNGIKITMSDCWIRINSPYKFIDTVRGDVYRDIRNDGVAFQSCPDGGVFASEYSDILGLFLSHNSYKIIGNNKFMLGLYVATGDNTQTKLEPYCAIYEFNSKLGLELV